MRPCETSRAQQILAYRRVGLRGSLTLRFALSLGTSLAPFVRLRERIRIVIVKLVLSEMKKSGAFLERLSTNIDVQPAARCECSLYIPAVQRFRGDFCDKF